MTGTRVYLNVFIFIPVALSSSIPLGLPLSRNPAPFPRLARYSPLMRLSQTVQSGTAFGNPLILAMPIS